MSAFRKAAFAAALGIAALCAALPSAPHAELTVEAGGAPMSPSKSITENVAAAKDLSALAAALNAAGLAGTLQGDGPFTLFAPVNKAFDKLPKAMAETLLLPENKEVLARILSYHVIPGKISSARFIAAAKDGGGEAKYKTMEGGELIVRQNGRRIEITGAKGEKAFVLITDVPQRNGVIHVIDRVLMPDG
ncbi:MAG TPA: fasciclin domain-containing protein [Methylocella sp.]|nr:fasciclin domain-containing protein [Methylocella sp.]